MVTLGKQFFWLAHGPRDEALRGVQQAYRAIELRAPDQGLADLGEMVLYCGHPGGTPEQAFRGYGGFAAMRRYLPTLKKMGIGRLPKDRHDRIMKRRHRDAGRCPLTLHLHIPRTPS